MDWKEKFKDKIMTPEEAVKNVKSGDCIIRANWIGGPEALMRALVDRASELKSVEIVHGIDPGPNLQLLPEYAGSFHHTSLFCGPKSRGLVQEGKADYIGGTTFHKWPELFAEGGELYPHLAFVQLSEPDEDGMCSWGNACCYSEPAARTATKIYAQINACVPYVGGKKISLEDIDYIVPFDEPVMEIPKPVIGDIQKKIGENVASLVEDGATIQIGLGPMADAIGHALTNKKGLGVHSEILVESMMELVEEGVITNENKTLYPGVCIGSQIAGTEEFYKYVDHNPMWELYSIDYTNDPYVIGQNYKMTSMNVCLEVDLLGQVASETINGKQYSGIGGQLDFVRGAQLSEGGKAILALSSTTKGVSKIVPTLQPGTVVTVGRYDVDYVVTEYGVAALRGKTNRQRALALIEIAHPDFREELTTQAQEMCLI